MSHETLLREFFARYLDFRPTERRELEEYFNTHARDTLMMNPLASDVVVDRWIGVGTPRVPLDADNLLTVITSHVLTRTQKDHLLAKEHRHSTWPTYLVSQDTTVEDLRLLIARDENRTRPDFCSSVLLSEAAGELDDATIEALFSLASAHAKLMFLARTPEGAHQDLAGRTFGRLAKTKDTPKEPALGLLLENRRDLYPALLSAGGIFLSGLAGSRHFTDENQQRALVRLDDAMIRTKKALDRLYKKRWALIALAHNPVADLTLVEELLVFLESLGDPRFLELESACRSRLASGRPHVRTAFEEIEDPMILGWLVNRCAPREGMAVAKRPYDARALLHNPHLSPRQREMLGSAAFDVETIHLLGQASTTLALSRFAPEDSGDVHVDKGTSLVDDFLNVGVHRTTMDVNTPRWEAFEHEMISRLGTEPTAWSTFFAFSSTWTLSWDELLTTVAQLSQGLR